MSKIAYVCPSCLNEISVEEYHSNNCSQCSKPEKINLLTKPEETLTEKERDLIGDQVGSQFDESMITTGWNDTALQRYYEECVNMEEFNNPRN